VKLVLAAVGRLRSREVGALRGEYLKRMRRYAAVETAVFPEEKGDGPAARSREDARIVGSLRAGDFLAVCDQRGRQLSSQGLAGFLAERERAGRGRTLLLVGGPYGVGPELRSSAGLLLGLSRLTLPHELAQLVLAEAVYRALSMLQGGSYHHD
jgi:23S rRNA (pseudouridine1915-N3)-methyltransferase